MGSINIEEMVRFLLSAGLEPVLFCQHGFHKHRIHGKIFISRWIKTGFNFKICDETKKSEAEGKKTDFDRGLTDLNGCNKPRLLMDKTVQYKFKYISDDNVQNLPFSSLKILGFKVYGH